MPDFNYEELKNILKAEIKSELKAENEADQEVEVEEEEFNNQRQINKPVFRS